MQDTGEHQKSQSVNLAFLVRLLRWRKLILMNTLIVAVLAVGISLLLPNWYAAKVSILPPQEDVISVAGLSSGLSGALGKASRAAQAFNTAMDLPFMSTPSDFLAGLLRSRRLREALITEHDLIDVYQVDNIDQALESFAENITTRVGREGIVRLQILDKQPQRAADMTATALRLLDEIQRETHRSRATSVRQFIDIRLTATRIELAAAEDSLQRFQETYGLLVPEEQAIALVKTVATVEVDRLAAQVQLHALRAQVGAEHPDVRRLTSLLESLEQAKSQLEGRDEGADQRGANGPAAIIELSRLPQLSLSYLRLYRHLKIQEVLFELLTELLEQYRIQEVRDLPTIQILDPPTVPMEKAKPGRGVICFVATLLAFFSSLAIAAGLERIVLMSETDTEGYRNLTRLLRGIGLGFLIPRT
jgi:uncharacterized protein involved in exopolysaccharide biosynthesis